MHSEPAPSDALLAEPSETTQDAKIRLHAQQGLARHEQGLA